MILPSKKLLVLLLAPLVLLVCIPSRPSVYLAMGVDTALLLMVVMDVLLSARPKDFDVVRHFPVHLSLGADNRVGWQVTNHSRRQVAFELIDDVPADIEAQGLPVSGSMAPRSTALVQYDVRPMRRGRFEFGDIHLRYHSNWDLLIRQRRIRATTSVRVYPNVANLRKYELAAQRRSLGALGLVRMRQRGKGSIYESLRDYVPGDSLSDIAWKATARRSRLTTRQFEVERSQNLLLVIDCGRLMTTQVDHLSRLDYAINASILLTYVAVKQADQVGMLAFSDQVESYLPPVKGHAAVSRMNESLYQLEPRLCESNYEAACRFLALHHRKRSLIVIFTDVIDTDSSAGLLEYTAQFSRRHVTLCVTMRNLETEAIVAAAPQQPRDCFRQGVALRLMEDRAKALAQMRSTGMDVLDVDPRNLTPRLLDRYLQLKTRRML